MHAVEVQIINALNMQVQQLVRIMRIFESVIFIIVGHKIKLQMFNNNFYTVNISKYQ